MRNPTSINNRLRTRSRASGYVRAEDVIGIRCPDYDEDNILYETLRQMPELRREICIGNYILGR